MSEESSVIIGSLHFTPNAVVVTYAENRKVTDAVQVQEQISIDPSLVEERVDELQDLIAELVDEGLLALRNPPKRRTVHPVD